jgi:hypothetical protein
MVLKLRKDPTDFLNKKVKKCFLHKISLAF